MPNRNYEAGRRKEYKTMRKLKAEGWAVVSRTAGSHGLFDVIAIRPSNRYLPGEIGKILLLQLKSGESAEAEIRKASQEIQGFTGMYYVEARAE